MFVGKWYWNCSSETFDAKGPFPLKRLGLPSELDQLDAAFVWGHNGKTYFFRNASYWRYSAFHLHLIGFLIIRLFFYYLIHLKFHCIYMYRLIIDTICTPCFALLSTVEFVVHFVIYLRMHLLPRRFSLP